MGPRAAAIALLLWGGPLAAQATGLPFGPGEALRYEVRVAPMGTIGRGRMWIEGPVTLQGVSTWRMRFELEAGVGPIKARDRTSSWFDPLARGIVRFDKVEDHPLSKSEEAVTIDRVTLRWEDGAAKTGGPLGSDPALDELSFIYLLRTLPLERDTTFEWRRHFDADRNPTRLTIQGREVIETPAGIFRTRVVEMVVRDPKRYQGTGRIRIHLDEDLCHVPVRIESRMPRVGVTTLVLKGWSHPPRYPGAIAC